MTNRWVTCTLAILALLLVWGFFSSAPAEADESVKGDSKIDERVLADTENGQSAHFIVVLSEQANLDSAKGLITKEEKGAFVTQQLREVAARTQPAVLKELDALGVKYRAYWITNMIAVQGDRSVVEALAKLPAVARIEPDRVIKLEEEPVLTPEDALPPASDQLAVEWGITKIGAPSVWSMGYTGQGIVIATQDTGQQWDHPALKAKYRGWNGTTANHNYNWWDAIHSTLSSGSNPCGLSTTAPCDDDQHGTHTTGTTVGEGGTNQIGVAPGARWIGCRNMDRGSGRPSTYTECFQFFLAPTDLSGNNPNPSLAPHIINNSWGCPHGAPPNGENCVVDSFKTVVENLRAAGIMVVVSNGNEGSACSTTGAPPAYLDAATSVGATDSSDNIASFSSRGPVTADGSSRIKPDISAPGVSVRSSVPGNGYASLSGTSMAGPHVAGAVALLWSARPELIGNIDATEQLLFNTAVPRTTTQNCGGVPGSSIPNNTYGYGRMDILAAVNSGTGPTPTPTNTPGPSTCTTFASTDVPKAISASGTPSVASILNISGSGTITDLNVKNLNGTHTWINDLDFTLQSPAGTSVQIMARSCSSQDNFNLNLDDEAAGSPGGWPCPPVGGGTYRPSNALSAFDGQSGNGTWTLTVRDNVSSDGGSLNGWSLEVCTSGGGGPTPTPTNTPTPTATQPPVVNTGFLSPSANAAVTSSSGDNNGFEGTAANAYSDNATFASDTNSGTSTATTCTSTAKDKHLYYNYNFAIPGTASIRGVEIRLDGRADSTASSPRFCVQLSWDGGVTWTTAKTTTNLTTTEATYILGSATDTWGRTWTPANFGNSSLRVRIIPIASSTARDFYLDWVAARVSYQ